MSQVRLLCLRVCACVCVCVRVSMWVFALTHKEVVLTNDLIDCARPGEEVDVTGAFCCMSSTDVCANEQQHR